MLRGLRRARGVHRRVVKLNRIANEFERREFFAALVRRMKLRGDVQAGEMLDMLCHGMDRAEINAHFRKKPNTLTQNLHRAIRRGLKDLGFG